MNGDGKKQPKLVEQMGLYANHSPALEGAVCLGFVFRESLE